MASRGVDACWRALKRVNAPENQANLISTLRDATRRYATWRVWCERSLSNDCSRGKFNCKRKECIRDKPNLCRTRSVTVHLCSSHHQQLLVCLQVGWWVVTTRQLKREQIKRQTPLTTHLLLKDNRTIILLANLYTCTVHPTINIIVYAVWRRDCHVGCKRACLLLRYMNMIRRSIWVFAVLVDRSIGYWMKTGCPVSVTVWWCTDRNRNQRQMRSIITGCRGTLCLQVVAMTTRWAMSQVEHASACCYCRRCCNLLLTLT